MTTVACDDSWVNPLETYEPSLFEADRQVRRLLGEMAAGTSGRWLTLTGKPGTGKTTLARSALTHARRYNPGEKGVWGPFPGPHRPARPRCVWIDGREFAQRLKRGEYELPEEYRDEFCVVFDDVGVWRDPSAYIADGVFRFACEREGKWTIWTSNFTLAEIGTQVDVRMSSRMIRDRNVLHTITAPDYALSGRKAKGAA